MFETPSGASRPACTPVWTNTSTRAISRPSVLLVDALARTHFPVDQTADWSVEERIRSCEARERNRLKAIPLRLSNENLLGAGYAFTEFLVAPVPLAAGERSQFCSLGALINLMVVTCDRLLDGGCSTEEVLPPDELARGGGEGSPVMLLLQEYFQRLSELEVRGNCLASIRLIVARMFQAEAATVEPNVPLLYRLWLRKSSLPFVLMGIAPWSRSRILPPDDYCCHIEWLYRIGRFFGAVDDAVDYLTDAACGHPNYWGTHDEEEHPTLARRVAGWGEQILNEWDRLAPRIVERTAPRNTFLYNIRCWLTPTNSDAEP